MMTANRPSFGRSRKVRGHDQFDTLLCCRRCWRHFRLRRLALQRGSGQGRSVHVCWCGGPSETEVEAVAEKHAHRGLSLLLLRDEPCTRCGEPTPPLDGRVICVRCAPVLWGCGGTERGQ